MSEIKQINTGVAEIIAVKITEECTKHHIGINKNGSRLFLWDGKGLCTHLPSDNWTPLGLSTELTEEQCMYIMPVHELYCEWWKDYVNKGVIGQERCATAKESFASLMKANGCYSVNPYGITEPKDVTPEEDDDFGLVSTLRYQKIAQWRVAQKNTGTWLILKRLS